MIKRGCVVQIESNKNAAVIFGTKIFPFVKSDAARIDLSFIGPEIAIKSSATKFAG